MGAPEILRPDERGRITLGKRAQGVSGYTVEEREDGSLLLHPMAEIPAKELWLWKNKTALASVQRGLTESAAGKAKSWNEDFSAHLKDEGE